MTKWTLDFISFVRNQYVEDYAWEGSTLRIWVNYYTYSTFINSFKKICDMDEHRLKACIQSDYVGINLAGTDLMEKHGDELRAAFPPKE